MSKEADDMIAQGLSMYWHAKHGTSYRDAIIEECARVAELYEHTAWGPDDYREGIAAAIRALKDKT